MILREALRKNRDSPIHLVIDTLGQSLFSIRFWVSPYNKAIDLRTILGIFIICPKTKGIAMENENDTQKNSELLDRLAAKEEPEQIPDWDIFKKDWLTLKEASELINRSDRYVRNIIDSEKIDSRVFVGGNFGRKPTRCVNKARIIAWFQENMSKKPDQINVPAQKQAAPQDRSLVNSGDDLQSVLSNMAELNNSLKSVSAQMADMAEKIADHSLDLKAQKDRIIRMTPRPQNPKERIRQTVLTILIIAASLTVLAYFGSMILTILLDIKK